MPPHSLTLTEFNAWWANLNTDFPPYKLSADDLARQGRRWYEELAAYSKLALDDALRAWLRESDRRPKLVHILDRCRAYQTRINAAFENVAKRETHEAPYDSNKCPCGCGGIRWAKLLPEIQPGVERSRDFVECLREKINPVPHSIGSIVHKDSRGVVVWRIDHIPAPPPQFAHAPLPRLPAPRSTGPIPLAGALTP